MRISQFQTYSQKENTVTNNVLLMLSRLNDLDIQYYRSIIELLNEENPQQAYRPGPIFKQQVGSGNGIIDGHIEVKPSKIVIEAKLNTTEHPEKLIKYGVAFESISQNQLWHLSSVKFSDEEVKVIRSRLKNTYPDRQIQFNSLTYEDLVNCLNAIYEENDHDQELKLLMKDFRNYCQESNLISNADYKLLYVPTGFSYDWNRRHNMYYCPAHWHSQPFRYFGLYNWKSVRTISEIEATIVADFDSIQSKLIVHSEGHTQRQIDRLQVGLEDLNETHEGLKYYILPEDRVFDTDFKKSSPGGIQGYRYKDLRDYLSTDDYDDLQFIASELRQVTWQ